MNRQMVVSAVKVIVIILAVVGAIAIVGTCGMAVMHTSMMGGMGGC
jgi:hypothetical protein